MFSTVPNLSSTPYKPEVHPHYHSSSTDNRCSQTPMDLSLYNSFGYHSPPGFGRGGVTPVGSVAGSQHISAQQTTEIFHLGAKCQVLGTQLDKQFKTLSRMEVMHHATAQVTTHKTINTGYVGRGVACSILMNGGDSDKKHEETLQKLCEEGDKAWEDTNNVDGSVSQ